MKALICGAVGFTIAPHAALLTSKGPWVVQRSPRDLPLGPSQGLDPIWATVPLFLAALLTFCLGLGLLLAAQHPSAGVLPMAAQHPVPEFHIESRLH